MERGFTYQATQSVVILRKSEAGNYAWRRWCNDPRDADALSRLFADRVATCGVKAVTFTADFHAEMPSLQHRPYHLGLCVWRTKSIRPPVLKIAFLAITHPRQLFHFIGSSVQIVPRTLVKESVVPSQQRS